MGARMSKLDADRRAAFNTPEDNLARVEMFPDWVVQQMRLLDPRPAAGKRTNGAPPTQGRKNTAAAADGCDRDFAAANAHTPGAGKKMRGGLLMAVNRAGSGDLGLLIPCREGQPYLFDGERYIYHWLLIVAARTRSGYDYATLDIACLFTAWKPKVDRLAKYLQTELSRVAKAAQAAGLSLRATLAAAAGGAPAPWFSKILEDAEAGLSDNAVGAACTIGEAGVLGIWQGMVYFLEVFGGIDVDTDAPERWRVLDLADVNVLLDALHSYTHLTECRLRYCPRQIRSSGRQDGEQVERANARLLPILGRVAAAGAEEAKQAAAEVCRQLQLAKLSTMARTTVRRIKASQALLPSRAQDLARKALELKDTVSVAAESDEISARNAAAGEQPCRLCPSSFSSLADTDLVVLSVAHIPPAAGAG